MADSKMSTQAVCLPYEAGTEPEDACFLISRFLLKTLLLFQYYVLHSKPPSQLLLSMEKPGSFVYMWQQLMKKEGLDLKRLRSICEDLKGIKRRRK